MRSKADETLVIFETLICPLQILKVVCTLDRTSLIFFEMARLNKMQATIQQTEVRNEHGRCVDCRHWQGQTGTLGWLIIIFYQKLYFTLTPRLKRFFKEKMGLLKKILLDSTVAYFLLYLHFICLSVTILVLDYCFQLLSTPLTIILLK